MYDFIKWSLKQLTGVTCKISLVICSPNSPLVSAEATEAVKLGFLAFLSPHSSTKEEKAD